MNCMKQQSPPDWTPPSQPVEQVFSPTQRALPNDVGGRHSFGAPVQIYPLYENGFRAHRRQSIADNHQESTKLYSQFSEVASRHPYAWNYPRYDNEETIGTVSKKNRMICFPCTCNGVLPGRVKTDDDRSSPHECVQRGESRCCLCPYVHRLRQGPGNPRGQVDLPS